MIEDNDSTLQIMRSFYTFIKIVRMEYKEVKGLGEKKKQLSWYTGQKDWKLEIMEISIMKRAIFNNENQI